MYKLEIGLDINTEIFPVKVDEYFSMKIVESISDGTPASDYFSVASADSQFVDEHDYVMHGKVFKYTHYQNITKHHAVWIADTYDELEKATRTYIDSPSRHQEGRKAVVKEQLGNYLGQAAKRSADLLCQLAND